MSEIQQRRKGEAVRQHGVICVSVPQHRWTRSVHEWEIDRLRGYLRAAQSLPTDTRLEIAAWLEQQEAYMEDELGAGCELPPVMAERIAWISFAVAVVSVVVMLICLTEVIL